MMHKRVNGVVVDINNIELFKLAGESKHLARQFSNTIEDNLDGNTEYVKDLVVTYRGIVESLVYPLNMIESDIRYMTIAIILFNRLKDKYTKIDIQIDDGICISIEDTKALRLISNTWVIEKKKDNYKPLDTLSLDYFQTVIGYEEYLWASKQLLEGKDTKDFYKKFMPDFYAACRKHELVLQSELNKILDFGYVPSKVRLTENKLIDIKKDISYILDIYCSGKVDTGSEVLKFTTDKNGNPMMTSESKKINSYNFDVYVKTGIGVNNKAERTEIYNGLSGVFDVLLEMGFSDDKLNMIDYVGYVEDDTVVFEVSHNVYICDLKDSKEAKKIMADVSIYSYEAGKVYAERLITLDSGVIQSNIYSYELATGKTRLCRISFEKR